MRLAHICMPTGMLWESDGGLEEVNGTEIVGQRLPEDRTEYRPTSTPAIQRGVHPLSVSQVGKPHSQVDLFHPGSSERDPDGPPGCSPSQSGCRSRPGAESVTEANGGSESLEAPEAPDLPANPRTTRPRRGVQGKPGLMMNSDLPPTRLLVSLPRPPLEPRSAPPIPLPTRLWPARGGPTSSVIWISPASGWGEVVVRGMSCMPRCQYPMPPRSPMGRSTTPDAASPEPR